MDNERTRRAADTITYHFVWTPKFRRAVLEGAVADRCVELLRELGPAPGGGTDARITSSRRPQVETAAAGDLGENDEVWEISPVDRRSDYRWVL
jgi:hypothetical protein